MTQTNNENQVPLIEMRDVTVTRDGRRILDSISLQVNDGENLALIGPNGSGKSSIIKVITGEYRPRADSENLIMRVLGKDSWNVFDLRDLLGIVSGDLQSDYVRDIKGAEVVLSGFFSSIGIHSNHRVTLPMLRKVYEIMHFLEITHLSDKMISEMSTGEARRVLIGRALVHDPRILVLDEASNSLDMKSHHQFREITRKVAASGKSIILVTHNLGDIIPEIGRVVLLRDGRIFADGEKDMILNSGDLSDLFDMPLDISKHNGYYSVRY
jgi:iron complex transport system ATP-binding protein